MRRYELELPVKLNAEQGVAKGKELARQALRAAHIEAKIQEAKEEAKEVIAVLKDGLTEARVQIGRLARAVRRMEELQQVDVEARVADDNSMVEVVRTDTGEVIETRALTEDDRQMQIEDVLARVEQDTKAAAKEPHEELEDSYDPEVEDEDDVELEEPEKPTEPE